MQNMVAIGIGAAAVLGAAAAMWACSRSGGVMRVRLAGVDDVAVGKMKEVTVQGPGGKSVAVLLVRTAKNRFRATAAKCTHANVSLANGVLCGDRVVCPAHAACFNVDTGDIEDG